jgi:hypothetical protein
MVVRPPSVYQFPHSQRRAAKRQGSQAWLAPWFLAHSCPSPVGSDPYDFIDQHDGAIAQSSRRSYTAVNSWRMAAYSLM